MAEEMKGTHTSEAREPASQLALYGSLSLTVAWFLLGYVVVLGYFGPEPTGFPMFTFADATWQKCGGVFLWLGFCLIALVYIFVFWGCLSRTARSRALAQVSVYVSAYCLVGGVAFGVLGTIQHLAPSPAEYSYIRLEPPSTAHNIPSTKRRHIPMEDNPRVRGARKRGHTP